MTQSGGPSIFVGPSTFESTHRKKLFDKIVTVGNIAFLMFSQFTVQEWN